MADRCRAGQQGRLQVLEDDSLVAEAPRSRVSRSSHGSRGMAYLPLMPVASLNFGMSIFGDAASRAHGKVLKSSSKADHPRLVRWQLLLPNVILELLRSIPTS